MGLKPLALPLLKKYKYDYLALLLIIVVSLVVLLFNIGDIPPLYPWSDESEIAADAVATLRQGPQLFYPGQLAGGSLAVWLEAGWMMLFGKSLLGLRVLNGVVNLFSLVWLYLLVRRLPLETGSLSARWVALTAALLLAVSTWLLGLGRIATPNWSLVPLMTTAAFYYFWLGLTPLRPRYLLVAGGIMGLLFYGYLPGYFVPLVPILFLAAIWITNRRYRNQASAPGFLATAGEVGRALAYLLPVMIIVAAPMLIFFALNPAAPLQRPLQLADTQELETANLMGRSTLDLLSAFGFFPDRLLQGQFRLLVFDPLVAVLFVIGLLIALGRWRKPAYLFLLLWWAVMIGPALLSRSASFGFAFEVWRRGIGAQPVSFIFPALAVAAITGRLPQFRGQRGWSYLTVTGICLVSAGLSYRLYFQQWANDPAIATLFARTPVEMVEWMETESQADTLFLFPVRPNVSPTTRPELFTVRYLYDGPAEVAFPAMAESTVNQTMTDLLANRPTVVKLLLPDRLAVDPKGYFEYALGLQGEVLARHALPGYTATVYQLRHQQPLGGSLEPVEVAFGEGLRLIGQRIQPVKLRAGQTLGVVLHWVQPVPQDADYNVRLALYDRDDYERVGLDKPLLSPASYSTSRHWPPDTETTLYFALPVPPDAPPGPYSLRVVAYNAQSGQQLPPVGERPDLSLTLADLELLPNPTPVDPAELEIDQPLEVRYSDGLRLVGGTSSVAEVNRPGDRLRVTLLWQATQSPVRKLGLMLTLVPPEDEPVLLFSQPRPLIDGYTMPAWPAGQTYRVNYSVQLPPTLVTGDYRMILHLVDLEATEPVGEQELFTVPVQARPHIFEAPPLSNQLNVDFGQVIRLRSFDIERQPPDQKIGVRLQWQARQEMSESYKVFLHLTDGAGQIVSQADTLPRQGAAPTTGWVRGEIIEDEISLTVPKEAPASSGTYRLLVGLYNARTGQRLPSGKNDHVVLFETDLSKWPG